MTLAEADAATKRATRSTVPRSFRLAPQVVGTIDRLATARGCSMATVVRQAVATEALLDGWIDEGGKVLLMDPSGTTKVLFFNRG